MAALPRTFALLSGDGDDGKFGKKAWDSFGSKSIFFPKLLKSDEENVSVVVRVRPFTKKELEKGSTDVLSIDHFENIVEIRNCAKNDAKYYKFDAVFPQTTEQAEMYNLIARPIIQNVIQGYNGTILAYGQTGTGKTYTMEGERSVPELRGIIPNSFAQIFSHIAQETGNSKFLVRVSYLEIYNEQVRDLLGKDFLKKLDIKENEGGVYVQGLSSIVVKSEKDMERILAAGKKNRSVGATKMNTESSRSHAIFTVLIECSSEDANRQSLRMGKLNLVDLAGSERAGKSGATGIRLREGTKINLSLSCLGNVISALVEGKSHIPYRGSKLTRLLQDSLGGNSKTVMIANVGPAAENYEETLSTLRYADRVKRIKNHVRINEDPQDALLCQYENEIEALKRQLEEDDAKFQRVIRRSGSEVEGEGEYDESPLINEHEETMNGIREELVTQQRLSRGVQLELAQKESALVQLTANVITWKEKQQRKTDLQEKLMSLQEKIMVGGFSLLDKSIEQEAYLQRSMQELQERRAEKARLRTSLNCKIAERLSSEQRILLLREKQERIQEGMDKWYDKLKAEELDDDLVAQEEKAEKELLEREIRKLNVQIGRERSLMDAYIPTRALTRMEKNMRYNSEKSVWSLRHKDFAGNNLKLAHPYAKGPRNHTERVDLSFGYKKIRTHGGRKHGHGRRDDGLKADYADVRPQRTCDLINPEESLKLMEKHDLLDPPTFHFLNYSASNKALFSKRTPKQGHKKRNKTNYHAFSET